MLVLTIVAATLAVAACASPLDNYHPTEETMQEINYDPYDEDDRYNSAFAQVFGDLKLTVPSLTVGQTIEVLYVNPPTGALSINLVTADDDVALHFNPRYSSTGGYLVLNTLLNGNWQTEVHPTGFPFPANNVKTRVLVSITVQEKDFLLQVNGIDITTFSYHPGLSYDKVRHITCKGLEHAVLEAIGVTY
uniref:Galectin n=1 Tax=Geodia cydonium TaxID=6047 RepID=O18429_GEOCY|nr:galectin [Geodia cydonium]CAC85481.1 galectin [Geodia cydonium]